MSLVSILAPVYQGEDYISRFLDCVLNFDYKNLELIVVNDGSTDNTEKIIKSYFPKFEEKNIPFKYLLVPKNKGQAHAINVGLKHVEGEYLAWIDADDIYFPNCISRCVEECKKDSEVKFVLSKSLLVKENDLDNVICEIPKKIPDSDDLFEDYLFWKNGVSILQLRFCETKALFDVLIDKTIYESNNGQNYQLMLPLLYHYKAKFINEALTKYVRREESHSATFGTWNRFIAAQDTIINTLNRINMPKTERNKYIRAVKKCYLRKKFRYLFNININLKKKKFIFILFGIGLRIRGLKNA